MTKLRIVIILMIVLPALNCIGQEANILDQFTSLDLQLSKQVISEDITVQVLDDESLGNMPEDSLNYKYIEKLYQKRLVRLDVEIVQKDFPEIVTVTPEGDLVLDYISMIPLLVEAIQEQQKLIIELESRLADSKE